MAGSTAAAAGSGTSSRPILLALASVNQTLPSGPPAIPLGKLPAVAIEYSVATPAGVMLPIRLPAVSVNQRLPSAPLAMPRAFPPDGVEYSVIAPVGVIFPMLLPLNSANHRLPSGPLAISCGKLEAVGIGYSVIAPTGVIFPIWLLSPSTNQTLPPVPDVSSVNQRLPSGPIVIAEGWPPTVGIANSVMAPLGVNLPI